MKLNSKLTGGLAWAGLIVVLAVPAADVLMGKKGDAASAAGTDAIRTAVVAEATRAPAVKPVQLKVPVIQTAAAKPADPVDTFVQSGKKLPSYISDAPAAAATVKPVTVPKLVVPGVPAATPGVPAATPTATLPPVTTGSVKPVEVANIPQAQQDLVAPISYPASKRPRVPLTASVSPTKPAVSAPSVTAPVVAATEKPVIIDNAGTQRRDEAVARVLNDEPRRVDADQLEEWNSGSLADYLERKGLMNGQEQASTSDFDENGFFLDEGPNVDRGGARVVRRIGPSNEFFF